MGRDDVLIEEEKEDPPDIQRVDEFYS